MNQIKEFLETITVLDTETTHVDVNEAEVVELGACRYFEGEWMGAAMLYGTARPIPPEASAIHNISNRMIEGLQMFPDAIDNAYELMFLDDTTYMVAHNSEYDRQVLRNNIKKSMNQNPFVQFSGKKNWICTLRLAKAVFNDSHPDMRYGLAYLRYALDLTIPETAIAHRAEADTVMTGVLFEFLLNKAVDDELIDPNGDIGEQCVDLCWAPKLIKKWPFGKHKGVELKDIPMNYFEWAISQPLDSLNEESQNYDMDLAYSVMKTLEDRM